MNGRMSPVDYATLAKPRYDQGHGKGRKRLECVVRFSKEDMHDGLACGLFVKALSEGRTLARKLIVELPSSESDAKDIARAFQTYGRMEVVYYD